MIFKGTPSTAIGITTDGSIYLEQYSTEFGKLVKVYITLDQFNNLETWVLRNKEEIEIAWNEGIEP